MYNTISIGILPVVIIMIREIIDGSNFSLEIEFLLSTATHICIKRQTILIAIVEKLF